MKNQNQKKKQGLLRKTLILLICAAVLVLAAAIALIAVLTSCENKDPVKLSFKSTLSYDYLKSIEGQTVTINGYLATSSPADGSFIFLMNMPYQSCPFCVPNTSQLSNTIEVYPKKSKTFDYTNSAVKVTGKLQVATQEHPFTDRYGYEFSFKIVDAAYTVLKAEELSSDMALWQTLSKSGIANDINDMYNYVDFLCNWPEYFVNPYKNENGDTVPGYYLYASDAVRYLEESDGQYHYGLADGYFEDIITRLHAIDPSAFADMEKNIRKAKDLAARAYADLKDGKYTSEEKYVEKFGTTDTVFTLNNGKQFVKEAQDLYKEFSGWLSGWEL